MRDLGGEGSIILKQIMIECDRGNSLQENSKIY
jgi:hypothetical protein